MARNRHQPTDDIVSLANSGARAETIRSAVSYILDREAEIKAIREDVNKYKAKHIKGDLGIKLSDFSAVLRAARLEDEPRAEFIDTMQEGWSTLGFWQELDRKIEAERAAKQPPAPRAAGDSDRLY